MIERKDAQPLVARRPQRRAPAPVPAPGADHRAWSKAFPPTGPSSVTVASLHTSPSNSGLSLVLPVGVECPARR